MIFRWPWVIGWAQKLSSDEVNVSDIEIFRTILTEFPYALLGSLVAALLCAYLGVYVVSKRVVFVGATLTQVAVTGIAFSHLPFTDFDPVYGSMGFTVLVTMLYLGLNLVFMYATPLETMKGVIAVGSLAASRLFGSRIAGVFSLLMALALVSTVNAMVTIGPRVYYAMARRGAFFRFAARVHPKWRTPVPAVLSQGLCAMLLTVTPFPQLVIYIAFSLTFFTVMSVASLFVFRRRPGWRRLAAVGVAFPLIPVAFIAVGTWMILYGVMLEPKVSAAAIATIASGAALYRLTERTRARQALAGQGH